MLKSPLYHPLIVASPLVAPVQQLMRLQRWNLRRHEARCTLAQRADPAASQEDHCSKSAKCRRRSRMQLLLPQEAAETAAQARDGDMLSKIQGMVGAASPLGLAVSQIKGRLQIPLRQ